MPTTSAHTAESIAAALQGGHGTMAKRFLQALGLPMGSGDSVQELSERVVRYRDEGRLSNRAIDELLRELVEYGEKRVFVMRGDPGKMKKVEATGFGAKAVVSLDHARVQKRPKSC